MFVSTSKRGRSGADTSGGGGGTTTTGNISATSLTATGAIIGDTVTASGNHGDPLSHSDAFNVAMHCAGGMSVNGLLWCNSLRTTTHHIVSDARTKQNIEPLQADASAALVRALNPVSYVLRSTGDATVGFVAQEVEQLDPRLVAVTAQGERSLDYRGISVHAVQALQEVQRQLDAVRAAVRALQQDQDNGREKGHENGTRVL